MALIATAGQVIGAFHWPLLATTDWGSKLTTTLTFEETVAVHDPDAVPTPLPAVSQLPPAQAFR